MFPTRHRQQHIIPERLRNFREFNALGLNTPSLLGIARSGPFLHDGSAVTLRARLMKGKDLNQHGMTAQLTEAEVTDLVSYLKTL